MREKGKEGMRETLETVEEIMKGEQEKKAKEEPGWSPDGRRANIIKMLITY